MTAPAPRAAPGPPARRRLWAAAAVAALAWVLAARILGPSDAWDQRQPRTIAYTTDVLVNGRWVLPVEPGGLPATKPPLYNWLAAPAVAAAGFSSELAHKAPSLAAAVGCWLAVALGTGPLLGRPVPPAVGWLAALALATNYTFFKLSYLARPDMVLTALLVVGWYAATALLVDAGDPPQRRLPPGRRRATAAGLWACVALAALAKGPAVAPLLVYGLVAARPLGGRWRAAGALGWSWGFPLALAVFGAWVLAAWSVAPGHVRQQLWGVEIAGRITGLGPEGGREGPLGLLTGVADMAFYYVTRFLPWSVPSLLGAAVLWSRRPRDRRRRWRTLGRPGRALHGAALFVLVTIACYTLSAGKRPDYVAAACGPGAVLAAWWLAAAAPRPLRRARGVAAGIAALLTLGGLTAYNQLQTVAPQRGFGDAINAFVRRAETRRRREPLPLAFWATGGTHVQSFLGSTEPADGEALRRRIEAGDPFWLITGAGPGAVEKTAGGDVTVEPVLRSAQLPRTTFWPGRLVMYRVDPSGDSSIRSRRQEGSPRRAAEGRRRPTRCRHGLDSPLPQGPVEILSLACTSRARRSEFNARAGRAR